MTTTAATASTRRHAGTYPAEPEQVRRPRLRSPDGWQAARCPPADEAILIASEFATNAA